MSDDHYFDWLYEQFRLLRQKVERLEGTCAQLRTESMRSALMFPTRQEFQSLIEKVKQFEQPSKPKKR